VTRGEPLQQGKGITEKNAERRNYDLKRGDQKEEASKKKAFDGDKTTKRILIKYCTICSGRKEKKRSCGGKLGPC